MANFILSTIVLYAAAVLIWTNKNTFNVLLRSIFLAFVVCGIAVLKKNVYIDVYVLAASTVFSAGALIWEKKDLDNFLIKLALIGMSFWGFWNFFS